MSQNLSQNNFSNIFFSQLIIHDFIILFSTTNQPLKPTSTTFFCNHHYYLSPDFTAFHFFVFHQSNRHIFKFTQAHHYYLTPDFTSFHYFVFDTSNRHIFKFTQATHLKTKSKQLFFTSMTTTSHLILPRSTFVSASRFIFLFLTLNY